MQFFMLRPYILFVLNALPWYHMKSQYVCSCDAVTHERRGAYYHVTESGHSGFEALNNGRGIKVLPKIFDGHNGKLLYFSEKPLRGTTIKAI
ncbi:hypothetical protein OUZ56_013316 [Daphnia magna]|uniref:Uncharacterized protein n=1 Tax=Daphnia magna TaxID=35525 RepID=A0ABQ9Z5I3_9CRUS|nr:hypothetical protein OUZ56_013316 [Daphnia magna]